MTDDPILRAGGDIKPSGEPASALEQVASCIERIERRDPVVHAFVDKHLETAMLQAAELDRLPMAERGSLHGVPLGVKEIFDVAGMICGWGSPIHAGRIPQANAEIVTWLKAAGAVIMGTTASTEYAMARAPATVNPHDPANTPGGSSSGSAAAVGGGLVPCALGSQTIGSGIRPAAYCGARAFKPSHGCWPLQGAMPLSETLDHPVIMAKEAGMLGRLFDAMSGMADDKELRGQTALNGRFVVVVEPWYDDPVADVVDHAVRATAEDLQRQGATVEHASISEQAAGEEECLRTILAHDMARHHGGDYDRHADLMSARLRGWIETGRQITAAQYEDALDQRQRLIEALESWLYPGGVILTAATVDIAPLRDQGTGSRAPQRLWSLVGFPAATVPAATANELPVGVQLVGPPGADRLIMDVSSHV